MTTPPSPPDAAERQVELSVVIPCSRPAAAARCLAGLAHQETEERFEVVVVGEVGPLAGQGGDLDLVLIPCPTPHPNARRNLGIARARGRLVGLLDDDTVPDPGWVEVAVHACPPGSDRVLTGPERPVSDAPASQLAFAVSQSPVAEGTRAHHHARPGRVAWSEVPFCNCVLPRSWFDAVGRPATDVPWDMDDFEFFFRLRRRPVFCSVPELSIAHDRYPESLCRFLAYKWALRRRTGEKLVSHPAIYGKVAPVVLAAALPWAAALLALALPGRLVLALGLAGLALYAALLATQLPRAARSGRPIAFLALLAGLHATTLLGVEAGLLRGLARRLRGRGTNGA